jgi:Tol biopolymer transport system component
MLQRSTASGLSTRTDPKPKSRLTLGGSAIVRDLAEPPFDAVQEGLAWSPDSRRIAYSGHSGDGNLAIWTMNSDGSNRRQLTFPTPVGPHGSGGDQIGAWSPDGKQLVYSSWRSGISTSM